MVVWYQMLGYHFAATEFSDSTEVKNGYIATRTHYGASEADELA